MTNRLLTRRHIDDARVIGQQIAGNVWTGNVSRLPLTMHGTIEVFGYARSGFRFDDDNGLVATHSNGQIQVHVPFEDAQHARANYFSERAPFLSGIVVHELVHLVQKGDTRSSYSADRDAFGNFSKIAHDPSTTREMWRDQYYSIASEIEAHGAQIGAEMDIRGCEFADTQGWAHIDNRMGTVLPTSVRDTICAFAHVHMSNW